MLAEDLIVKNETLLDEVLVDKDLPEVVTSLDEVLLEVILFGVDLLLDEVFLVLDSIFLVLDEVFSMLDFLPDGFDPLKTHLQACCTAGTFMLGIGESRRGLGQEISMGIWISTRTTY